MIYITQEKQITGKQIIAKTQDYTTEYEKSEKYPRPVNYKLAMITLTLPSPQIHDDETIKSKCLNQFLIEMKNKFQCSDYIWKAEKQENKNIHFHILVNRYIHHEQIKTIWNRIIDKLGYCATYAENQREFFKNGFRMSDNSHDKRTETQQRAAFEKSQKENWSQPNSTDIHALYKVKNAGAYLTKYLAKGVTKTERTEQIKLIRKQLFEHETLIINIDKKILFDTPAPAQLIKLEEHLRTLEEQKNTLNSQLEELLKTGVSGRIWGQSQTLSKLKPFTEVQQWENIPNMAEVEKHKVFKIENTIGTRKIYSYIIDIKKFSTLNQILTTHLNI
jgi:hypothetical protein